MTHPVGQASRLLRGVSGGVLLLGLLAFSLLVAAGLSLVVLTGAANSNQDFARAVETRAFGLLEGGGLSGLVAEIDRGEDRLVPETADVAFAVWRNINGELRLLSETVPGMAEVLENLDSPEEIFEFKDIGYKSHSPDIAEASRDWEFQMADVRVSYAIPVPTPATLTARRQLVMVWSAVLLTVLMGVILHLNHRRRYADGLDQINAVLDEFAAGNTRADVEVRTDAPELQRLSDHLNIVLPRFDRLVTDLRALTAHLAHEMNTPLQIIRADVNRLSASEDAADRKAIAVEIDDTIDATNARLGSVMRLFRLSADDQVTLETNVDLGALVAEQFEVFEDLLIDRDREITLDLANNVRIDAHVPLLELAIANMLSNAAKFAPDKARIGSELTEDAGRFRLRTWNTGSAFPDEWTDQAFERLSRAEGHRSISGFGLGLALVDMITRWHGFTVSAGNDTDPATGEPMAVITLEGPCDTAA